MLSVDCGIRGPTVKEGNESRFDKLAARESRTSNLEPRSLYPPM